jgi:hypothetical protein
MSKNSSMARAFDSPMVAGWRAGGQMPGCLSEWWLTDVRRVCSRCC